MLKKAIVGAALTFIVSAILFCWIWQYQQRKKDWTAVTPNITSSEIAHGREKRMGLIWTAQVSYSFQGETYSQSVSNLPLDCEQIYVNPANPDEIAAHNGQIFFALLIPGVGMGLSLLFACMLVMIKISPD